ncbi:DUF421 domain-containing protein [Elioraea rosea]|uniref:DUF421 domain-containing protein n=1 Tax=Elioraea rosea TaxID=2492390 RepID=UPI00118288FA|nr:YetF domain-containing protein [Elioraea rosea]
MHAVASAIVMYLVIFGLFRVTGRRSLAQATPFDLVLLLLIGEAAQDALLGGDPSLTNALIVIVTLLLVDVVLSLVKRRWKLAEKVLDGVPTILVENGRVLADRIHKARLSEDDVLQAARASRAILSLEGVRYAILETDGTITIVPKEQGEALPAPRRDAPIG